MGSGGRPASEPQATTENAKQQRHTPTSLADSHEPRCADRDWQSPRLPQNAALNYGPTVHVAGASAGAPEVETAGT